MFFSALQKTISGMRSTHSEISLQAIEFWSTLCDVEIDIAEGLLAEEPLGFASTAVGDIIPVLYELLSQKEDDDDDEDWNVSMAAATCLSQFAMCVQDQVLHHGGILNYVQRDLTSANSKSRDCALLAFGNVILV